MRQSLFALCIASALLLALAISALLLDLTDPWALSNFYNFIKSGQPKIEIRGNLVLLDSQAVLKAVRSYMSRFTFFAEPYVIKKGLLAIPFVRDVSLERRLDGRLRIYLLEREPVLVAEVYLDQGESSAEPLRFVIDRDGIVLPWVQGIADKVSSLPKIYGIPYRLLQLQEKLPISEVDQAIYLLRVWPAALPKPVWIDVSEQSILQVRLEDRARVRFGLEGLALEHQLRRLEAIYKYGQEHGRVLLQVDLSHKNHCPALWRIISSTQSGEAAS